MGREVFILAGMQCMVAHIYFMPHAFQIYSSFLSSLNIILKEQETHENQPQIPLTHLYGSQVLRNEILGDKKARLWSENK